jgi:hypothetical protein
MAATPSYRTRPTAPTRPTSRQCAWRRGRRAPSSLRCGEEQAWAVSEAGGPLFIGCWLAGLGAGGLQELPSVARQWTCHEKLYTVLVVDRHRLMLESL